MTAHKMQKSLPAFVWDNFRLQRADFIIVPVGIFGFWLLVMLLLAAITFFSGDNEIFGVGIPGALALVGALMLTALTAFSRIWIEFKIGVQMSIPRRRMLAAELLLSAATATEGLLTAWLLDRAWMVLAQAAAARYGAAVTTYYEPVLAYMLWWGWLLCWLLPPALGSFGGAVVLRFGAKGGWTLYLIMMTFCLTVNYWIDPLFDKVGGIGDGIMAVLPALGVVLAFAAVGATVVLLRRVAITD